MTVVVGVKYSGGVVLSADSFVTYEPGGAQREMRDSKIVKFTDTVAIAVCGSLRVKQVLQFGLEIDGPYVGEDEFEWAVNSFVGSARDALRDAGALWIDDSSKVEGLGDAGILLAVRGRLFSVAEDLDVLETTVPWACDGSGWEVAAGRLTSEIGYDYADLTLTEATRAAESACMVGEKLNAYVGGRIVSASTSQLSRAESKFIKSLKE